MILKPGEKAGPYRVEREVNRGGFAISYLAADPGGRRVFLKQFTTPKPRKPWFRDYVQYQDQLKRRIESSDSLRRQCYEMLHFFTADRCYYQVFEFLNGGMSLEDFLEEAARDPKRFPWESRVTFARTMMHGINQLHRKGVVHTDLKPDNLYLEKRSHLNSGFRIRLIDFDFAVLEDARVPWIRTDGTGMGYVSTPGYASPEHIQGDRPTLASDVFTCGIILSQVLGGRGPFDEAENYDEAVLKGRHSPVRLLGEFDRIDSRELERLIETSLDPNPRRRPTSETLHKGLLDTVGKSEKVRARAKKRRRTRRVGAPKPTPSKTKSLAGGWDGVVLTHRGTGKKLPVRIGTSLGQVRFRSWHPDARFLSRNQFRLERDASSRSGWTLSHCPDATHQTLANGAPLTRSISLEEGMCISVGNASRKIEKLPLIVEPLSKT